MPDLPDPHDLQRFVDAQAPVWSEVLAELRAGHKRTHWMWFVFPQHRALGRSAMAQRYGIGSLEEAQAYWQHPVLGPRLAECCRLLLALPDADARRVFGSPDDLKLRSSMTLFGQAVPQEALFGQVLDRYDAGAPDPLTLEVL